MVEPFFSGIKALSRILRLLALFAAILVVMGPLSLHTAEAAEQSLTWTAPTTYNDGTPVTDLAGYKLYTGIASGSYQQSVDTGNRTSYTLSALSDGATYYFAVTAYDTAGVESAYSNEWTRTFPAVQATHLITATSGSGGTITALNNPNINQASSGTTTVTSVTVKDGASQAFSIAAATGYRIVNVAVDGTSVGAVTSYSFMNVTASHSIEAVFAVNSNVISASADLNGTISPAGTTVVSFGGSQTYTMVPAPGYHVADVTVDGTSVGAITSYTFSNVTSNHSIKVVFAIDTHQITASAGNGGSINPSGTVNINHGDSRTFTIAPKRKYQILEVKVDGVSLGAITSYTFANVQANHSITASFKR